MRVLVKTFRRPSVAFVSGVAVSSVVFGILAGLSRGKAGEKPAADGARSQEESAHYPAGFRLPSTENIERKTEYTCSVSTRFKFPNWVAEKLEGGRPAPGTQTGDRKHSVFKESENVDPRFRACNEDYWDSGWSRGHLAPASLHRATQSGLDETFLLSQNILPQDLSQNGADWARLEQFVGSLRTEGQTVYVVSGPLWMPDESRPQTANGPTGRKAEATGSSSPGVQQVQYPVIGKTHKLPVPTHLFKVVKVGEKSAAFVLPNRPIHDEQPLFKFLVELDTVEEWTGLDLNGMRGAAFCEPVTRCTGPTGNARVQGWRLYGKLGEAGNVQRVRRLAKDAVDRGYLRENFLLAKLAKQKIDVYGVDAVFEDELVKAEYLEVLQKHNL